MTTVSLTLPADGQTIDASDVNTPFNALAAVINGAIDSTNISDGGVTPNELVSGTGTTWAESSYTPTFTNFTVSGSTVTGKFIQIGKRVFVRVTVVTAGGNAPSGSVGLTLPVTADTHAGTANTFQIGLASLFDTSASRVYTGKVLLNTTGTASVFAETADLIYGYLSPLSSLIPYTWANGDEMSLTFNYPAA